MLSNRNPLTLQAFQTWYNGGASIIPNLFYAQDYVHAHNEVRWDYLFFLSLIASATSIPLQRAFEMK